ncbi:hypothetical protein KP509_37G014000 [Ceratopteris richardii]|uniref:Uncharacterized protein n=1 Tax=Ceratopteris richardii TaxID=49495 RepID=A0A8T2Q6H7_CERRI|nr:hypothetical protein KP509_37G014000 [Ceratopteris richardii]
MQTLIKPVDAAAECKLMATCINCHGTSPLTGRGSLMETSMSGGSFASLRLLSDRPVCQRISGRSIFSAHLSFIEVKRMAQRVIDLSLLRARHYTEFIGDTDHSGDGSSGSGGGQRGGGDDNNDNDDEASSHASTLFPVLLPELQALFQYIDENKLYEGKFLCEKLSFLIDGWFSKIPVAYALIKLIREDEMVNAEHPDASMSDAHDFGRTLIMDCSLLSGDLSSPQGPKMHLHASEKQAQSEKQCTMIRTFMEGVNQNSKTCFHLLQGLVKWLKLGTQPAFAMQVPSSAGLSKSDQSEEQESRGLAREGSLSSQEANTETGEQIIVEKQSDVGILKRLQREAFYEIMKLREKLEKLEQINQARQKLERLGGAKTNLKGEIEAGTAFVVLEDESSRHARDSLEQAGMQTGLNVKFTFETPFRENDLLITQILSGHYSSVGDGRALGGPLRLGKLHYIAHVNDEIAFSFVPLGAQAQDVTEIINVLQGQGLTSFSSQGPALYNHCKGSAIGTTVGGSKFALSLGQYLSGWDNHAFTTDSYSLEDPLCYTTLGQLLFQPVEGFVFSLCGLNRYWPTPPLPSSMALHWSEMGPLIFPRIKSEKSSSDMKITCTNNRLNMNKIQSQGEPVDLNCRYNTCDTKGTGLLSLAISSSLDFGESLSLSGWAQVERGELIHDPDRLNYQWALSVARNSGSGIDWGASIGGSRSDVFQGLNTGHGAYAEYTGADMHGSQLQIEAFLKLTCGKGFTLQPGLLYIANQNASTPAFVIRSTWSL